VGDATVALTEVLGSEAEQVLAPALGAQVATLQLFRGVAKALPNLAATGAVKPFLDALEAALDDVLGGSSADGACWSPRLHKVAAEVLGGENLVQAEQQAVSGGHSRACVLLGALGQLYEHSHLLLAEEQLQLSTMDDVCTFLLGRFPGLADAVRRLVLEHNLCGIPALQPVFEHIDATSLAAAGGLSEPEPEPAAALDASYGSIPEGVPPSFASTLEWLADAKLEACHAALERIGYGDDLSMVADGDEEEIAEILAAVEQLAADDQKAKPKVKKFKRELARLRWRVYKFA
jgi:hypothetical protein